MTYDINKIPLNENSVIWVDYSGDHDFTVKAVFSCQAGKASFTPASIPSRHLVDRCNNRTVRSTNRHDGPDSLTMSFIYTDDFSASDDEFDTMWDNKGEQIAIRVFPAGTTSNARYFQIIGPSTNVTPPGVVDDDGDYTFDADMDGVMTKGRA